MTTISSVGTVAALLILRRPEANGTANAADTILKTANNVSAEPGKATTQATAAAANALLDKQARSDALVTLAVDFLESDKFKSSDPDVKDTLKGLVEKNREALAAKIDAERERDPMMPLETAIAHALTATIRENRKQFGEGEFVIGYDTKLDGKMLHYIADVEGKSGAQMLADSHEAARIAFDEARQARAEATEANLDATSLALLQAQRRYDKSSLAMREWNDVWYKLFDWKD
ncbi:hypothetical protein [Ensifer sp. 4252]|uniref:hypothetical protein n=1 Tax=Ensifer sp. 4252 TaxID=3373915 RepID=UPI003D25293F